MKFITRKLRCIGAILLLTSLAHPQDILPQISDIGTHLDKAFVTEPNALQATDTESEKILETYMISHWRDIVTHWNDIATTENRKRVLLSLGERLDPANYMNFLESVRDLRRSESISATMFEFATIMPGQRKEAFLSLNFRNPRVRNFIGSIRELLPRNSDQYLDDVLSGIREDDWEERYQKMGLAINSSILLPSSKDTSLPSNPNSRDVNQTSALTNQPTDQRQVPNDAERTNDPNKGFLWMIWRWIAGISIFVVLIFFVAASRKSHPS